MPFPRTSLQAWTPYYRIVFMIKFVMCDLPLLLHVEWFQTLQNIDSLQVLLTIFPVVMLVSFAVLFYSFVGKLAGQAVIFHKTAPFNEAGSTRHESPLWFALGP